ncbi:hypothetical protein QCD85_20340 [Paenibacillus sp. PsM32]|uniref:hypothetical protein n=1 Tax=Paenibacillus sp. PsM32 TaxID=3030536 RepID=UPI00263B8B74|nr:hypothetical protein [Paenibacillus sp. PsM32]MDN4620478.1 hypothetical protein [Paenibacillus sp. PsM32]
MIIIEVMIIYIFFTFISTYIHELGHALSAYFLGAEQVAITKQRNSYQIEFKTYFSFSYPITFSKNIIISFAGVVVQFLFSVLCIIQPFSISLSLISLVYMPYIFFNILYFYGLDGYYVLENLKTEAAKKWSVVLTIIFGCSWIFAWNGLLEIWNQPLLIEKVTYLVLSLFIWGQIAVKFIRNILKERRLEYDKY